MKTIVKSIIEKVRLTVMNRDKYTLEDFHGWAERPYVATDINELCN